MKDKHSRLLEEAGDIIEYGLNIHKQAKDILALVLSVLTEHEKDITTFDGDPLLCVTVKDLYEILSPDDEEED